MILSFRKKKYVKFQNGQFDTFEYKAYIPGECPGIVKRKIIEYLMCCTIKPDDVDEVVNDYSGFCFLKDIEKY